MTYDAAGKEATGSYDNKTTTDIYSVALERVYAYDVNFSNGTSKTLSLTINGKDYRDGDVAYLSEHSPEWVVFVSGSFTGFSKDGRTLSLMVTSAPFSRAPLAECESGHWY